MPTPITPCCPRRWRSGASDFSRRSLPRHLQIIFEINKRFLEQVEAKWPGDAEKKQHLSLIEEGAMQMVRMAHLAVVGGHSVNGVAALHTKLLKKRSLPGI